LSGDIIYQDYEQQDHCGKMIERFFNNFATIILQKMSPIPLRDNLAINLPLASARAFFVRPAKNACFFFLNLSYSVDSRKGSA
jgi:hypothetical protein